jgi:hypothetical protein
VTMGAEPAFAKSMTMLGHAIAVSRGTPVLDIAGALIRP